MPSDSDDPLPYNGDIQEAIRNRDRDAVKKLLSLRSYNSEEKEETSVEDVSFPNLKQSLISLGFSSRLIDAYLCDREELSGSMIDDKCSDLLLGAAGVQALFESSNHHFPIPKRRAESLCLGAMKKDINSSLFGDKTTNRVSAPMLRTMDTEYVWTLMQACVDNPDISQLECFGVLQTIGALFDNHIINSTTSLFLRDSLVVGCFDEVKCITNALGILVERDHAAPIGLMQTPSPPRAPRRNLVDAFSASPALSTMEKSSIGEASMEFDQVGDRSLEEEEDDSLLQSFTCPITREILIEPITLQCGHNFTKSAIEALFKHNPTHHHRNAHRSCPVCKTPVSNIITQVGGDRSQSFQYSTNVVLRDAIERLYPHVLRRRAVEDIQATESVGIEQGLRNVIRWLQNFPRAAEVVHAVVKVLLAWLIVPTPQTESVNGFQQLLSNRSKIVKEGHVPCLCKSFEVLPVHSESFEDMLKLLCILTASESAFQSFSNSNSHYDSFFRCFSVFSPLCPDVDITNSLNRKADPNRNDNVDAGALSSTAYAVDANIHLKLLRLLCYQVNPSLNPLALQLICQLFRHMECSHLKSLLQLSIDASLLHHNANETSSEISSAEKQNISPIQNKSYLGNKKAVDPIRLMLLLVKDHCQSYPDVSTHIFFVFSKYFSRIYFGVSERDAISKILVEEVRCEDFSGGVGSPITALARYTVIDALRECISTYSASLFPESSQRALVSEETTKLQASLNAILQCMVFISKLSSRSSHLIRHHLLQQIAPLCIEVLSRCDICFLPSPSQRDIGVSGMTSSLVALSCQALFRMMYSPLNAQSGAEIAQLKTPELLPRAIALLEKKIESTLGISKLISIRFLLRYHLELFNKSLCCRYRLPLVSATLFLEDGGMQPHSMLHCNGANFCAFELYPSLPNKALLVKVVPHSDAISNYQREMDRKSFSVSIQTQSDDGPPLYMIVVREKDEADLKSWVSSSLKREGTITADMLHNSLAAIPLCGVNLTNGVVTSNIHNRYNTQELPRVFRKSRQKSSRIDVIPSIDPSFLGSTIQVRIGGFEVVKPCSFLFSDGEYLQSSEGDASRFPQDEEKEDKNSTAESKAGSILNSPIDSQKLEQVTESRADVTLSEEMSGDDLSACPALSLFLLRCENKPTHPSPKSLTNPIAYVSHMDFSLPNVQNLRVLPTVWQFCDERNVSIRQHESCTQLLSATLPLFPTDAQSASLYKHIAVAKGYSSGVCLYQFTASSRSAPESSDGDSNSFLFGVCSNDFFPLLLQHSEDDISSRVGSLLSLQYSSSGKLYVGNATGFLPLYPCPVDVPNLAAGDTVHMEVVHEGFGSIRVFHNGQIVFELGDFRRLYHLPCASKHSKDLSSIGIGPFVWFSGNGQLNSGGENDNNVSQTVVALDQFSCLHSHSDVSNTSSSSPDDRKDCSSQLDWAWLLSNIDSLLENNEGCRQLGNVRVHSNDGRHSAMDQLIDIANSFDCKLIQQPSSNINSICHVASVLETINANGSWHYENCPGEVDLKISLIQILNAFALSPVSKIEKLNLSQQFSNSLVEIVMAVAGLSNDSQPQGKALLGPSDMFSTGALHLLSTIIFMIDTVDYESCLKALVSLSLYFLNVAWKQLTSSARMLYIMIASGMTNALLRTAHISSALQPICCQILFEVIRCTSGLPPCLVEGFDRVISKKSLSSAANICVSLPQYIRQLHFNALASTLESISLANTSGTRATTSGNNDTTNLQYSIQLDCDDKSIPIFLRVILPLCGLHVSTGLAEDEDEQYCEDTRLQPIVPLNSICFDARTQAQSHIWMYSKRYECTTGYREDMKTSPKVPVQLEKPCYEPLGWKEELYFALLSNNCVSLLNIINMQTELSLQDVIANQCLFKGYGPWLTGHRGNFMEGLSVPCSLLSAATQLCGRNVISEDILLSLERIHRGSLPDSDDELQLESGDNPLSSNNDDHKSSSSHSTNMATNEAGSGGIRRNAPRRHRTSRTMNTPPSSSASSRAPSALAVSTTTAATIAAIRSLVRDEHIRMLELTAAVGINVESILRSLRLQSQTADDEASGDDEANTSILGFVDKSYMPAKEAGLALSLLSSTCQAGDGYIPHLPAYIPDVSDGNRLSARSSGLCQPPPGPSKFLYPKSDGTAAFFDATHEACAPFGLFHGQTVASHTFGEDIGIGVVVGVLDNHLWIHFLQRGLRYGFEGVADELRPNDPMVGSHLQGDVARLTNLGGATYRDDDWRFADLFVVDIFSSEADVSQRSQSNTADWAQFNSFAASNFEEYAPLGPSPASSVSYYSRKALQGGELTAGDRVKRGESWQWRDQDGHPGNMGTVVRICSQVDCQLETRGYWVLVEWDSSGSISGCLLRNTYRWGVDGNFDLEKITLETSCKPDCSVSSNSSSDTYRNATRTIASKCNDTMFSDFSMSWSSAHKEDSTKHLALTKDEKIRQVMQDTPGLGKVISSIFRQYIAAVESETTSDRCSKSAFKYIIKSALVLASYDRSAVVRLELGLHDIVFLVSEISSSILSLKASSKEVDLTHASNCAKLASMFSSTGVLFEMFEEEGSEALADMTKSSIEKLLLAIHDCITSCGGIKYRELILSSLRFLHDIVLFSFGVYAPVSASSRLEVMRQRIQVSFCTLDLEKDIFDSPISHLLGIVTTLLDSAPSASTVTLCMDVIVAQTQAKGNDIVFLDDLLVGSELDKALRSLAEKLCRVVSTPTSCVVLKLVMNAMKAMERCLRRHTLGLVSADLLLEKLLEMSRDFRDFYSVVEMLWSNVNASPVMLNKCVEIITGGRTRQRQKKDFLPRSNSKNSWSCSAVSCHGEVTGWRSQLEVGQCIDAKDKSHHWYEAIIRDIRDQEQSSVEHNGDGEDVDEQCTTREVYVHYSGWGSKYDEWIPCSSDRLQLAHSETGYWRNHLRLDDPIEILCLHQETSSESTASPDPADGHVKRRWFRGVVTEMQESEDEESILVVYDKRGCREERWVNVNEKEEICNVGTHVPVSFLGSQVSDAHANSSHSHLLLKSARKRQLYESGCMGALLKHLSVQIKTLASDGNKQLDSLHFVHAAFDALQYLLPAASQAGEHPSGHQPGGSDNMMSNSSCLCAFVSLQPEGVLCEYLSFAAACLQCDHQQSGVVEQEEYMAMVGDILEIVCNIVAKLICSQEGHFFSVGDSVDAQWRRRGNMPFPGRITRIRTNGNTGNFTAVNVSSGNSSVTFDITYDDGDHEERVPLDRITQKSSISFYDPSRFLGCFLARSGAEVLMELLSTCIESLSDEVIIYSLAILSAVVESGQSSVIAFFWKGLKWSESMEVISPANIPLFCRDLFSAVSRLIAEKSSSHLVMQALHFINAIAESSTVNKNRVYAMGGHVLCINCLSAFPHHPMVLCESLALMSTISSPDEVVATPDCVFSSSSGSDEADIVDHTFWRSEDRVPSESEPHWIEINLTGNDNWAEVQLQIGEFGDCTPEQMVVKYRGSRDGPGDWEVINAMNVSCSERWLTVATKGDVIALRSDSVEEHLNEGVIRIEITRNHYNGSISCLRDVRVLFEPDSDYSADEVNTIQKITEDERKNSIAALDGVSMVVECLVQSKTNDRDQYNSGRHFLQTFASDDMRDQFVVACGGGYII